MWVLQQEFFSPQLVRKVTHYNHDLEKKGLTPVAVAVQLLITSSAKGSS